MARRSRRSWKPEVARLESRDVPTVVSPLAFNAAGLRAQQAQASALDTVMSNTVIPAAGSSNGPSNQASSSAFLDPTTLTPRGRAAALFKTQGSGPYAVSPPLYNSQTKAVTYLGTLHSTQFLHGTLLMRIELNKDGTADGFAAVRNRNVAATGSILVLDIGGFAQNAAGTGQSIPSTFDSLGRPVTLGFNVDTNASGGVYAGAYGQGTLTITYNGNHGKSKNSAGSATVFFNGLVLPNNVADITQYDIPKFN